MKIRYDDSREEIDVGCIYADNCFECPFSDCICKRDEMEIQGEELEKRRAMVREAVGRVKEMKSKGMKMPEIAKAMGLPEGDIRKYMFVLRSMRRDI